MKPRFNSLSTQYPTSWQRILPMGELCVTMLKQSLSGIESPVFLLSFIAIRNTVSEITWSTVRLNINLTLTRKMEPFTGVQGKATPYRLRKTVRAIFTCAWVWTLPNDPHQFCVRWSEPLNPHGHLVVVGFNRWSLCGLFKYLPY